MDTQKKLTIQMVIFATFIMGSFALIILNEFGNPLASRRAEREIINHIEQYYQDNYHVGELIYDRETDTFKKRLSHKQNDNLYFTIRYYNREVIDDYLESFVEGRSLFSYFERKYTRILNNTNYPFILELTIPVKLNDFNQYLQEKIIEQNSIRGFSIYKIKSTGVVDNFYIDSLIHTLFNLNDHIREQDFLPMYYGIDFLDKTNNTQRIVVEKLERENINKEYLTALFMSILNENKEEYYE